MVATKRTLLVVEDEDNLNKQYALFCKIALQELSTEGLSVKGTIEQAFDYSQAEGILKSQPVDFISIDIALSKQEEGLTEEARKEREPGGMHLLRELQGAERRPISIVVTGESLESYTTDAWRKYRVLNFYKKDKLDLPVYINAVKATLWYLDAAELIAEPKTELDIEAAGESWEKALKAAEIAGIEERDFPEVLGHKIKSVRAERTHSISGFPVGRWTEEKLKNKIVGREDWALIRVTIKGFNEFVATYASQEEPILLFIANLLKKARDEFQHQDLFIGHLGHYEYISEPSFVIIPGEKNIHHVADMAHWIESEFKKVGAGPFTRALENEASQQGLTFTVEAKAITGVEYTFPDLPLLLDTLRSSQL